MAKPLAFGATLWIRDDARAAFAGLRELGLPTAQIFPPASLQSAPVVAAAREFEEEITSVIAHFAGESYRDIAAVQNTVGLVPVATREARTAQFLRIAGFARECGVACVQTHIGFIPEDADDEQYGPLVEATRQICDALARDGQIFALETGQETAATLKRFLLDVNRPNLRLNFDPANMILYGNDAPLDALEILFPWIESLHAKDGKWPTQAGQLGRETPLGEGDVDFQKFLPRLLQLGYRGTLTIEREIEGEVQRRDILTAKTLLESLCRSVDGQQRQMPSRFI